MPIYKYKGIGDENHLKYYKDGKYDNDDHVLCRIKYVII
jgi:hypothetical protein